MKKQALISVHDKSGIVDFARELTQKHDFEIISTGGTAKLLKENNISVVEVSEITKFPEMLDGRVKTLHPVVHAGILARRDKKDHLNAVEKLNIGLIDLVVINLYPFEEVSSRSGVTLDEAIENIDIGGPSMIRSAAKNYKAVTVVCDNSDFPLVLNEFEKNNGQTSESFREKMAAKAYSRTSQYDKAITSYLSLKNSNNGNRHQNDKFPDTLNLNLKLKQILRYGENPHQNGALYVPVASKQGLANAVILQGKGLSYNNFLDLESAWNIASEFNIKVPISVIVKHNNPCGVAILKDL